MKRRDYLPGNTETFYGNVKLAIFLFLFIFSSVAFSQKPQFKILEISLPAELADGVNEFSGLCIHDGKLFFMSESRLQENAEGKLYAIRLSYLDHKMRDSTYALPFQKYQLYKLDELSDKIAAAGQHYEGLEAILIDGNDVYLSIETDSKKPSADCYLIKGQLQDTAVILNTDFLVPMAKPARADGSLVNNAGFEAIGMINKQVYAFFEFNYFPGKNYVQAPDTHSQAATKKPRLIPIKKLPFRITDITASGKNQFTAINYFNNDYAGDSIYRTRKDDLVNDRLIRKGSAYRNYTRLITVKYTGKEFTWETLWEFPEAYLKYNWEGIAAYKDGYFIMNDKYTPQRPYKSTLLYLQRKGKLTKAQ